MKKLLLLLLCVPLMFSCGEENKEKNEDTEEEDNITENICDTEADFILTAEEFEDEDKEMLDKKYKGKIVQISGDVCSWGTGNDDGDGTVFWVQVCISPGPVYFNFSIQEINEMNASDYIRDLPKHKTRYGRYRYITLKGIYDEKQDYIAFKNSCVIQE